MTPYRLDLYAEPGEVAGEARLGQHEEVLNAMQGGELQGPEVQRDRWARCWASIRSPIGR